MHKQKSVPLVRQHTKAGPADGLNEGEFIVYPSTFTRTPDSYGDVVKAGAFANSIAKRKEQGITLPGLFGHRLDDPDFYVASALDEGEDEHGWWVKGVFDMEDPKAAKVYRLVKSGRIRELSFAYETLDEGGVVLDGGVKANELREVDTHEFSFVPVGANRDTSVVAVKAAAESLTAEIKAGRVVSAKNEDLIRSAYEALGELLDSLDPDETDDSKTFGAVPVKDEDALGVKSAGSAQSHVTMLTQIALAELD